MPGIDVGGAAKRSRDHQLPLVPFIDFLLCLISFLLITAVWNQMARINVHALVPGPPSSTSPRPWDEETVLHVEMRDENTFKLLWKRGHTVLDSTDVPRRRQTLSDSVVYPELAAKIADEWRKSEARHFAANDSKVDQAVLHTDDAAPFEEVIAVIDAIRNPQREWRYGEQTHERPAFEVTFAVN